MNYAAIKKTDVANGPGVRVSLFVSGCTHHCKGCFNSETWDFDYGQLYTQAVENEILKALEPSYIRGFTALGGEPFEEKNRYVVLELMRKIKEHFPEKDIWCYTGYDYEKDLLLWIQKGRSEVAEMLGLIDVLVDGEFVEEQKNLKLAFRGSMNQRLIDVQASAKSQCVVKMKL